VQPGDTLFAIAQELGVPVDALMAANGLVDADALSIGQVLAIPDVEGPVGTLPSPTPRLTTPQATVTPNADARAPRVEIRAVSGAGVLDTESVLLLNTGGVASMAGWTLDDGQGRVYGFPIFTLHNNGSVVVHTQAGTDTVIDLYWGLDEAVWTQGKVITLRDASGAVQSTFQIP
jgi:murein DD-endopeptidase MepM/ murein hydrolase activator NlpD